MSPHATERARFDEFVTSGKPIDEITKAAKRRRCDLIVMGTHGLTGADKLLFIGSTTHGVLQRDVRAGPGGSQRSLATPQRRVHRGPAGGSSSRWSSIDVQCATPGRPSAVARSLGSAVLLVHVVPELKSPQWLRKRMGASERTRIAQAQSRLEALAAGLRRHGEIETRVLFGDATRELAKLAATERAGLVIMTLRTPRDWFGPRRGSISYEVLSQVTTPVLALPG